MPSDTDRLVAGDHGEPVPDCQSLRSVAFGLVVRCLLQKGVKVNLKPIHNRAQFATLQAGMEVARTSSSAVPKLPEERPFEAQIVEPPVLLNLP